MCGPKLVPLREEEAETQRHTHRENACDDRGPTGSHEGARKNPTWSHRGEHGPADTLIVDVCVLEL